MDLRGPTDLMAPTDLRGPTDLMAPTDLRGPMDLTALKVLKVRLRLLTLANLRGKFAKMSRFPYQTRTPHLRTVLSR